MRSEQLEYLLELKLVSTFSQKLDAVSRFSSLHLKYFNLEVLFPNNSLAILSAIILFALSLHSACELVFILSHLYFCIVLTDDIHDNFLRLIRVHGRHKFSDAR